MAVPKRRTSHAKQGHRRSHQHVKPRQITYCNQCNSPMLPSRVCWNCGWSNSQARYLVEKSKETSEET